MRPETTIISPSGNFYGSEQVLFDFLSNTKSRYHVLIPSDSDFMNKLKESGLSVKHHIEGFSPQQLLLLYGRLALRLLCSKPRSIYVNEGGHLRWCSLMARLFTRHHFVVHMRIEEDVVRLEQVSPLPNLSFLVISKFMLKRWPEIQPFQFVYDPFDFSNIPLNKSISPYTMDRPLRLGVIGRVSRTKGLDHFYSLMEKLDKTPLASFTEFHFYGDIVEDPKVKTLVKNIRQLKFTKVIFHGFADRDEIYGNIDAIIHLNPNEPLGRIFFESLAFGTPLIGFNSGGIGELAELLSVSDHLVDYGSPNQVTDLIALIEKLRTNYGRFRQAGVAARVRAEEIFAPTNYANKIEELIN